MSSNTGASSVQPAQAAAAPAQPGIDMSNPLAMPAIVLSVENPLGKSVTIETAPSDCILDVRQFLSESPDTCYFTAYTLEKNGRVLNDYAELHEYPELVPGGEVNTLKMVPISYDERSAREHVRRLRRVLVSPPVHITHSANAYIDDNEEKSSLEAIQKRLHAKLDKANVPAKGNKAPQDPLKFSLVDLVKKDDKETKVPVCVRNINYSAWNSPPGNRQLRGDLLYLEVTSIEGNTLHITGSTGGFFLNSSSRSAFDPTPAIQDYRQHTLVQVLRQASPAFNKTFSRLMSRTTTRHPFLSVQTTQQVNDWVREASPHKYDWNRAEDTLLSMYGMDNRGVVRDWNEEYQCCRELGAKTLSERVLKDRTTYRVYLDFVEAATKGATALINGNIPPINPMDSERSRVYLYNKIFFSLAIDGRNQYHNIGGDQVSHRLAKHDLRGIEMLLKSAVPGLHTLATTVVDYRGHRVIAQSIIPGIFHGDKASSHLYGSMENGKDVKFDDGFHSKMKATMKPLHIKEHPVLDAQGKSFNLACSVESKGIEGSDRRSYLLDLVRCCPRDANFPTYEKNPCALLRPELVASYARRKAFLEVYKKQEEIKKVASSAKGEAKKAAPKAQGNDGKEAMSFPTALSSVQFNCDALTSISLGGTKEDQEKDVKALKEAAGFLISQCVPKVLRKEFASLRVSPIDGTHLKQIMHKNGINLRYLGHIASESGKLKLFWIQRMCIREMMVRAARDVLRGVMREATGGAAKGRRAQEDRSLAPKIAAFLTAFLGDNCAGQGLTKEQNEAAAKVAEARNRIQAQRDSEQGTLDQKLAAQTQDGGFPLASQVTTIAFEPMEKVIEVRFENGRRAPVDRLAPANLWQHLRATIEKKYTIRLPVLLSMNQREKLLMLRSLCKLTGLVVRARDYFGEGANFTVDDVLDVQPIVHKLPVENDDARQLMEQASMSAARGNLKHAYLCLSDALGILHQVYGPIHKTTGQCYTQLARVCYRANNILQAIEFQQKALIINERTLGKDDPLVATAHSAIALLLRTAGKHKAALKHMKRSLYLLNLIAGQQHPDTAVAHVNIAQLYQDAGDVTMLLMHLRQARKVFEALLGRGHPQVAFCDHQLAVALSQRGNYRQAIIHEKQAKAVYTARAGGKAPAKGTPDPVKQSNAWLKFLTENAVKLEKGERVQQPNLRAARITWLSLQQDLGASGRISIDDLLALMEDGNKPRMVPPAIQAAQKRHAAAVALLKQQQAAALAKAQIAAAAGEEGTTQALSKSQKRKAKRKAKKQEKEAIRIKEAAEEAAKQRQQKKTALAAAAKARQEAIQAAERAKENSNSANAKASAGSAQAHKDPAENSV